MENIFRPSSADILGLIVLSFLIYLIHRNDFMQKGKSKQFLIVVGLTILIITLEILSGFVNYHASADNRTIAFIINICGFSLMFMLPVLLGMLYSEKVFQYRFIYLLPAFIGAALCVCSIWTGWIFSIGTYGVYHRGSLFFLNVLITVYGFLVLLYAHIDMAKEYDDSEKTHLALLYLTVILVTVMQLQDPKMEVMWGGIAVAEMMYYVFLRELQFKFDIVTQVRNRICFEDHLTNIRQNQSVFLVEFDVNDLKYINDKYGHNQGDVFLNDSARILKEAYDNCGKLYRIGGDEFAVIALDCTEEEIKQARKRMLEMLAHKENAENENYYIANAYCRYDPLIHSSIHECLKEADKRMYEDKKQSKR